MKKCNLCGVEATHQGGFRVKGALGSPTEVYSGIYFCPDHVDRDTVVETLVTAEVKDVLLERYGPFEVISRRLKD